MIERMPVKLRQYIFHRVAERQTLVTLVIEYSGHFGVRQALQVIGPTHFHCRQPIREFRDIDAARKQRSRGFRRGAESEIEADSKPARDWRSREGQTTVAMIDEDKPSAEPVAAKAPAERTNSHETTRLQEIQRPGQVILEWRRPFQAADEDRATRVSSSYNSTQLR